MDLNKNRDFKVNMIGESGGPSYMVLSAYGTSYNCTDTGAGNISLTYDGRVIQYNSGGRGLTLVVINHSTREVIHNTRYDVYAYDSEKTALANYLDSIHSGSLGNVIYAMVSFDAIGTNSNLSRSMETARAYHWFNLPGLGSGPTHRHPYAAIGTSRLGIIKEMLHSNTTGASPSNVSMHVPFEWDVIGSEGYGPDFAEGARMNEYSITSGYGFAGWTFDWSAAGWRNVKPGEWIRLTAEVKIDLARKESGGGVAAYLNETDWTGSSNATYYYTEWTQIERYFQKPTSNAASLGMGMYHMPNSNDTGTSYARNIQVQKCGFAPNANRDITLKGVDELDGRNIVESAGPFSLLDPDTYWTVFHSERNLTGRPNLGDSRRGSGFDTNNVQWFNRELTDRRHYSIHEGKDWGSGDSNLYSDIGRVNVDHNKMYVGLLWQYCHQKNNGHNYFGTHTYNSSGGTTATLRYDGASSTTNPYSMYPYGTEIEKGKWSLFSYWFLPSWFTNEQGTEFYNKYWCNWAGNYENASADNNQRTAGSRWANGGNIRVAKLKTEDTAIHLRWLDYYNQSGSNHKTWWALPMIIEVDPLNFGANGAIDSWNLIEDSTYAATRAALPNGIL